MELPSSKGVHWHRFSPFDSDFNEAHMRTATAFFLALGILLSSASMAQDRSMDENVVRGLDNEERLAALQRDLPALGTLCINLGQTCLLRGS